jgi:putative cell wall-binding protein
VILTSLAVGVIGLGVPPFTAAIGPGSDSSGQYHWNTECAGPPNEGLIQVTNLATSVGNITVYSPNVWRVLTPGETDVVGYQATPGTPPADVPWSIGLGGFSESPTIVDGGNFGECDGTASVARVAGADRYATAAAVSQRFFATAVPVAFVATGTNFPDALAAGPTAGGLGGPVLLTRPAALPAATINELQRLQPGRIVVLGGPSAVSDAVVADLGNYTAGAVSRVAGADRYATAAQLSAATYQPDVPVAYVAFGGNFPDALAAGPAAGSQGGPVLLTRSDAVPPVTFAELVRLQPAEIVVVGSATVVSDAVVSQLSAVAPVARTGGANRYATAVATSARAFSTGASHVFLATGINYPDALAGVSPATVNASPLLLTQPNCIPAIVQAEIDRLAPDTIILLGGEGVLSAAVISRATC